MAEISKAQVAAFTSRWGGTQEQTIEVLKDLGHTIEGGSKPAKADKKDK